MTQVTEIDCGNDLVHTFIGEYGVMATTDYIVLGEFGAGNRYYFPKSFVKQIRVRRTDDDFGEGQVTGQMILEFKTQEESVG